MFKRNMTLAQETGSNFQRGIVLYLGDTVVPFGPKLHAVPLSFLFTKS